MGCNSLGCITVSLLCVEIQSYPYTDGSDSIMQETWVPSLDLEDLLEKGKATHSSILAWRIPRTEEPGGLQSMQLQSQTQLSN